MALIRSIDTPSTSSRLPSLPQTHGCHTWTTDDVWRNLRQRIHNSTNAETNNLLTKQNSLRQLNYDQLDAGTFYTLCNIDHRRRCTTHIEVELREPL